MNMEHEKCSIFIAAAFQLLPLLIFFIILFILIYLFNQTKFHEKVVEIDYGAKECIL